MSTGNLEITKYLVQKGADVNAKTAMGRSALLKAIWNG
jgi:ankyrin repeat protein